MLESLTDRKGSKAEVANFDDRANPYSVIGCKAEVARVKCDRNSLRETGPTFLLKETGLGNQGNLGKSDQFRSAFRQKFPP